MGCHKNIGYDKFPEQGPHNGQRVKVCFNFNTERTISGVCVRDDIEDPGLSLFQLDDGRVVSGTECQYSLAVSEARVDLTNTDSSGAPKPIVTDSYPIQCGVWYCSP